MDARPTNTELVIRNYKHRWTILAGRWLQLGFKEMKLFYERKTAFWWFYWIYFRIAFQRNSFFLFLWINIFNFLLSLILASVLPKNKKLRCSSFFHWSSRETFLIGRNAPNLGHFQSDHVDDCFTWFLSWDRLTKFGFHKRLILVFNDLKVVIRSEQFWLLFDAVAQLWCLSKKTLDFFLSLLVPTKLLVFQVFSMIEFIMECLRL